MDVGEGKEFKTIHEAISAGKKNIIVHETQTLGTRGGISDMNIMASKDWK